MRAALIYQHATTDRDRNIADALSVLVGRARTEGPAADNENEDRYDEAAGPLIPVA